MRLTRVDNTDLNLFEFGYDLTMIIFFLDGRGAVYARYGGRDAVDPDRRQSLAGLHYTMQSVLEMHAREESKLFARKSLEKPRYLRDVADGRRGGRCLHCHQVREILNDDLRKRGLWDREMAYRYPLPENIGLELELDRGNIVKKVQPGTPAAEAGLKPGDRLRQLNGIPIHSFGDVQYALDRALKTSSIPIEWQHGEATREEALALPEGWRKSDLSWRHSMHRLVPEIRLYGTDLTDAEKAKLDLPRNQLAFRQRESLSRAAREAGIQAGDIILGIDDKQLEGDVNDFLRHVQANFLVGDRVTIQAIRGTQHKTFAMTLTR